MSGDGRKRTGKDRHSEGGDNNDHAVEEEEEEEGDAVALPSSGLRLAVVFNPTTSSSAASADSLDEKEVATDGQGLPSDLLPTVFEAVGNRSPDKVRRAIEMCLRFFGGGMEGIGECHEERPAVYSVP